MPKTQVPIKPIDPYAKTPFFKVDPMVLSKIDGYLSTPLDRFHLASVIQQSPMRSGLMFHQKPRYLFKIIRERRKKQLYLHPPSLPKAIAMTSGWLKRKGCCLECLNFPVPVHIDYTRDDRHPRCFSCVYMHYQYRKDRPRCPCGSDLIVRKCTSDTNRTGRAYYLVLVCEAKAIYDEWKADYSIHALSKSIDMSNCIDHKQISHAREYWSTAVEKHSLNVWKDMQVFMESNKEACCKELKSVCSSSRGH